MRWRRSSTDISAGARPNATPVTSATIIVKSTTRQIECDLIERGIAMRPPTIVSRPRCKRAATPRPAMPPAVARIRLSVSIWRTKRPRPAPSAVRMPDFACAGGASRQLQIGDIDARDKEHQRDRGHQRQQRRPDLADHLIGEAEQHHRASGIAFRLFLLESGVDRAHLSRRILERGAVAQARQRVRPAASARGAELLERRAVRNKEVRILSGDAEARRHDADDGSPFAVRRQRRAKDVGAPAECALPELVAQDDDVVAAVLFDGVDAAERRLHAECAIGVGGHRQAAHLQRLAAEHDRESSWPDHPEMVEGAGAFAPYDKVRGRNAIAHGPATVGFPDGHHPIGLVIRQRLEQDRALQSGADPPTSIYRRPRTPSSALV